MWIRIHEYALRSWRPGVRAEADPGFCQFPANIVFRHEEIHGINTTVIFNDEVNCRFRRIRFAFVGDFLQRLAGERSQVLVFEANQQDVFRARADVKIFPFVCRPFHLGHDARANIGIFESCDPGIVTTFLHP